MNKSIKSWIFEEIAAANNQQLIEIKSILEMVRATVETSPPQPDEAPPPTAQDHPR